MNVAKLCRKPLIDTRIGFSCAISGVASVLFERHILRWFLSVARVGVWQFYLNGTALRILLRLVKTQASAFRSCVVTENGGNKSNNSWKNVELPTRIAYAERTRKLQGQSCTLLTGARLIGTKASAVSHLVTACETAVTGFHKKVRR